jgi:hypothetical protein
MLGTTERLHKLWPLERYSAPQSWLVSGHREYEFPVECHEIASCHSDVLREGKCDEMILSA